MDMLKQINRITPRKKYCTSLILIIALLVVTGCKKVPKLSDLYMDTLEKWSSRELGPETRKNLSHAIKTYKNKMMDPTPILIEAGLTQAIGDEQIILFSRILDEDEDILGFVIKEESQDQNGVVTTLEEDYPAFIHDPRIGVANTYAFDISTRKGEHRKNIKDWEDHLAMDFDSQVKQQIGPPPPDSSEDWYHKYEQYSTRVFKLWKSSLPTIYISIPDHDKINVRIYVYDKAGNKSNTAELVNHTRED